MQYKASFRKLGRATALSVGLLAALAFGTVAAQPNEMGLTECDHACVITTLADIQGDGAAYQVVRVTPLNLSAYVSAGPGELGFTR